MTVGEVCLGGAKIVQNQAATARSRSMPRFIPQKLVHGSKTVLVRLKLGRVWVPSGECRLKEVKRLCKEFGFTAGMLKGSLAEGRKKK
jgi:hypothetical protein